jgi:tetratricopeptide (TPR) repeat protein
MSHNDDNPIADIDFSTWSIGESHTPQEEKGKQIPSETKPASIDLSNWSLEPEIDSSASASPQPMGPVLVTDPVNSLAQNGTTDEGEPETADDWIVEGEIAFGDSDLETAARCFQGALRLDPINALALSNLAVVHHTRGELESAERFYLKAAAFDVGHADSYYGLAQLWCDNGNHGLALRYAARGLQRAPEHAELVELSTALSAAVDAQLAQLHPQ